MNPARTTSSLAIASLVSGILGWTLLPVLGTLVAIVTGHMARAEIRRRLQERAGDRPIVRRDPRLLAFALKPG